MRRLRQHPEVTARTDALLWSINERLGSLCAALGASTAGLSPTRLTGDYLNDLLTWEQIRSEQAQEAELEDELEGYD